MHKNYVFHQFFFKRFPPHKDQIDSKKQFLEIVYEQVNISEAKATEAISELRNQ